MKRFDIIMLEDPLWKYGWFCTPLINIMKNWRHSAAWYSHSWSFYTCHRVLFVKLSEHLLREGNILELFEDTVVDLEEEEQADNATSIWKIGVDTVDCSFLSVLVYPLSSGFLEWQSGRFLRVRLCLITIGENIGVFAAHFHQTLKEIAEVLLKFLQDYLYSERMTFTVSSIFTRRSRIPPFFWCLNAAGRYRTLLRSRHGTKAPRLIPPNTAVFDRVLSMPWKSVDSQKLFGYPPTQYPST